ncbi:ATP-binding protein [Streptomyces sp. Ac-502]|uniref:ATP-binding protein n=1 Tax=Streptomyces sp. Ac-502 TaxID=3342801 RepID=UPI003862B4FB
MTRHDGSDPGARTPGDCVDEHRAAPGTVTEPAPAPEDRIVGRDAELARLFRTVDSRAVPSRAADSRTADSRRADPAAAAGPVLVLTGDAGTGKSALLDAAARRAAARDTRVLRACGSESESDLAFSALHQLLRPVRAEADALPPRQRAALHDALGTGQAATAPDPLLFGLAVLSLLSALGEQGPVLAVLDDAQWCDRASLDALAFAARRLAEEPVTVLVGARTGDHPPGFDRHVPALALGPLDDAAAHRLLDLQPHRPTGRTRTRVLDQAGGNPWHWPNWRGPPPAWRPAQQGSRRPPPAPAHRPPGTALRRPPARPPGPYGTGVAAPGRHGHRRPRRRTGRAAAHRGRRLAARRAGRAHPPHRPGHPLPPPADPVRRLPRRTLRRPARRPPHARRNAAGRTGPARLAPRRRLRTPGRGRVGRAGTDRRPGPPPRRPRGSGQSAATCRGAGSAARGQRPAARRSRRRGRVHRGPRLGRGTGRRGTCPYRRPGAAGLRHGPRGTAGDADRTPQRGLLPPGRCRRGTGGRPARRRAGPAGRSRRGLLLLRRGTRAPSRPRRPAAHSRERVGGLAARLGAGRVGP